MNDVTVLIPCYKSPELLKVSIKGILESTVLDTHTIVILNDADKESIEYLDSVKVQHIDLKEALGPPAVDKAIPYLNSKYVTIAQSDHIFQSGWDKVLVELIESREDIMFACCGIVEPYKSGAVFHRDNLGKFVNEETYKNFHKNCEQGKYDNGKYYITDAQPSLCRTKDFLTIGGYSNNFQADWFEITACRGLDIDYVYRMWNLYNKKGYSIATNKAVVYHGVSLNQNKYPKSGSGKIVFQRLNNISIQKFYEEFKLCQEIKLDETIY